MQPTPCLLDLDDACLVNIFGRLTPLPHLFSIAAVCKRFRKLGGDGRLWLTVAGTGLARQGAVGHRSLSFSTLREAVIASRPGDTILVEPGVSHSAQDITVEWPLRLLGGGSTAEDTVLLCSLGANSAIDFRASGILANLSVCSEQSACVTHHRGTVVVDSCLLHSTPTPGLEHLFYPLVTTACSPPSKRARLGKIAGHKGSEGVLSVKETKIRGGQGMRAVRNIGTGIVAGVRVITFSKDAVFWFEVDSGRHFAHVQPSSSPADSDWGDLPARMQQPQLPAWAVPGKPLFPAARQLKALAKNTLIPPVGKEETVIDLDMKSRAWQRSHLLAQQRNVKRCL